MVVCSFDCQDWRLYSSSNPSLARRDDRVSIPLSSPERSIDQSEIELVAARDVETSHFLFLLQLQLSIPLSLFR